MFDYLILCIAFVKTWWKMLELLLKFFAAYDYPLDASIEISNEASSPSQLERT
jgi:hypothetical protein